ncbi:ultra-long-chain fatty acid omega-hydroxylase-like [Saccoglossus kowalevskii]|uniref:Cytochrome P450 4F22-like n=1 Tax=Saccoglossus kowalevskii TaxID=10224 RepID=A0ABM0GY91_SACKO|nr:PREDICTED: cytochrome P450 4F22-like [Saccoglossus kowalevskii]
MAIIWNNLAVLVVTVSVLLATNALIKIWSLIKQRRQNESDLSVFPCPPRHWLFGHEHLGLRKGKGIQMMFEFTKNYSHYFQIWIGPFRALLFCVHPDTVKTILATPEPKDPLAYGRLSEWLGDGLLISSGAKWKRNRRLLTPSFHFEVLKPYIKLYNECAQKMLTKWSHHSSDTPMEMFDCVSLMTLDTLLNCIFGINSSCQERGDDNTVTYVKAVRNLSQLFVERMAAFYLPSFVFLHLTPRGRKYTHNLKVLHNFTRSIIQQKKRLRAEGSSIKKEYVDFLEMLLDARDDDGVGLSDQEIQDEVDIFMFEGHDTTASAISWCLYNLARYPDYQYKCRDEIDEMMVVKDNDEIEWNDLQCMPETTMFIKESLRMNPPVPATSRQLTSPMTFPDGKVAPVGSIVVVAVNALHHNSHVWENPDIFDPMRFSSENSKKRSPHAFVPFAAGARNCIGQNFAMNEIKVVIGRVLHQFELYVDDSCPFPQPKNTLVLKADPGIFIKFKQRKLKI